MPNEQRDEPQDSVRSGASSYSNRSRADDSNDWRSREKTRIDRLGLNRAKSLDYSLCFILVGVVMRKTKMEVIILVLVVIHSRTRDKTIIVVLEVVSEAIVVSNIENPVAVNESKAYSIGYQSFRDCFYFFILVLESIIGYILFVCVSLVFRTNLIYLCF